MELIEAVEIAMVKVAINFIMYTFKSDIVYVVVDRFDGTICRIKNR